MIDIPENIRKSATKCSDNLSCLANSKDCLCDVEDLYGNVLFIKRPDTRRHCEYSMHFGESVVCNCPVRKKLYHLHKI